MTSSRHCGRRATFHAPDNTPLRRSSRRPVPLPVPSRRASMTSQRNGVVGGSRNRRRTLECKPRPRTWTVTNVAAVTKHRPRQPRRVFFARFFRTLQSNSLSACLGLSGRYCSRKLFFTRQKGQPTRHRISIGYVGAQFKKSELSVFPSQQYFNSVLRCCADSRRSATSKRSSDSCLEAARCKSDNLSALSNLIGLYGGTTE